MFSSILACLTVALVATAVDLGDEAPSKPFVALPAPPVDPAALRQGGDTLLEAVPLVIPGTRQGTTAGYTNDYDEVCPSTGSTSPDVVYLLTPIADLAIVVDMYGSQYDTKIYIYDQYLDLVACNDDFYPDWTSRLENVPLVGCAHYYLVIDGYGGDAGEYQLSVTEFEPCVVDCPAGGIPEGEPPLVDGYVDNWNGGCNSAPAYPFQHVSSIAFCGRSGYYLSSSGGSARDTDWFTLEIEFPYPYEVWIEAEEPVFLYELGPTDCSSVGILQSVAVEPCNVAVMTITGAPGSTAWVWVGPQTFWNGETYEFDYVLHWSGPDLAVEPHSWTAVKQFFE